MKANTNKKNQKDPQQTVLVFKRAIDKKELEEAFKLRYLAYEKMGAISSDGAINYLEVEAWDYYSIHGIAYLIEDSAFKAVGTIRIIVKDINYKIEGAMDAIFSDMHPDYMPSKEKPCDFPFLKTFELSDFVKKLEKKDRQICEIDRLVVHPEYWGSGLALHKGLQDFATAIIYGKRALKNIDDTYMQDWIILCPPKHVVVYQRMGFQKIGGTGLNVSEDFDAPVVAMHGNAEGSLRKSFLNCKPRAKNLFEKGFFCRCKLDCEILSDCELIKK